MSTLTATTAALHAQNDRLQHHLDDMTSRRLNIRISPDDYAKLQALRGPFGAASDSELIRMLIRDQHKLSRSHIRRWEQLQRDRQPELFKEDT